VQAEDYQDTIKPGLVALLPRLKRFADLLAGEKTAGTALLGRALKRMLAGQHRYQRSTAIDRFAFAEIYRQWLDEGGDDGAASCAEIDKASFAQLFHAKDADEFDPFTVSLLYSLPPQHRLMLLLVYGEGFDDIDVGRVLDIAPEAISARLVRISASLADCLSRRGAARTNALDRHYAAEATS
jgi:DNA-directed RNA polymerase specialized sigma24 family protein